MSTLGEYIEGKKYRELLELYRRIQRGEVEVFDPSPPRDYLEYLARLDYSLWLWSVVALVALTIASIALSGIIGVFTALRYILGTVFVLFLPGYSTIEALYPGRGDLGNLERLALSIGLSLALVPLIGLVLNYTPWGIRLDPVTASLTLYTLTLSFTASYRKYTLVVREAYGRSINAGIRGRVSKQ